MYDNIRFWIDRIEIGEEVFQTLPSILHDAKEEIDIETGESKTKGFLANLRVSIYEAGMSVQGSLSRFYHWEEDNGKRGNLYPLNRHDTQKAIEMLSQKLGGVPMQKAKVRALEFGTFILVNYPVSEYLKRCGDYPRLMKIQVSKSTIYYKHKGKSQPKTLCLYDKKTQAKHNGYELPEGFEDYNLLKYELRLNGSIGRQLKCGEVTGETLYDNSFYKRLTQTYQKEFDKITKLPQTTIKAQDYIKSVSDGVEVLLSRMIREAGIEVIDSFIDELKGRNVFADRANYSRLKKKLSTIATKTSTGDDLLLREMENGIFNICIYV